MQLLFHIHSYRCIVFEHICDTLSLSHFIPIVNALLALIRINRGIQLPIFSSIPEYMNVHVLNHSLHELVCKHQNQIENLNRKFCILLSYHGSGNNNC